MGMRLSTNVEDHRNRPPAKLTIETAHNLSDLGRALADAQDRGEKIDWQAPNRRIEELVSKPTAAPPVLPRTTENPLAAAAGYNDLERFRPPPGTEPYPRRLLRDVLGRQ